MTLNSRNKRVLLLSFLIVLNIYFATFQSGFSIFIFVFSLVFSVAGLYSGSEGFVEEAESVGSRLGMSGSAIGVIIIALGSVADEIFVSTISALHGRGDLGFGNIQGSNVITLLPFFALLPFYFKSRLRQFSVDTVILVLGSVFLVFAAVSFKIVPSYFAIFFFAIFIIYFAFSSGNNRKAVAGTEKFSAIILVLSLVLIYFASDSIVKYSVGFSTFSGIPYFLSGFVIAGIAGSLPEVFMMAISFRKTRPDMAFGVIVGSTTYKITLVLGLIASLGNMEVTGGIWSTYVLLVMSIIMFAYTLVERKSYVTAISAFGIVASVAILAILI